MSTDGTYYLEKAERIIGELTTQFEAERAKVKKLREALVNAAIPLEAFKMVQESDNTFLCRESVAEVLNAISVIRKALKETE